MSHRSRSCEPDEVCPVCGKTVRPTGLGWSGCRDRTRWFRGNAVALHGPVANRCPVRQIERFDDDGSLVPPWTPQSAVSEPS